jgi:hypothetical protein
MRTLVNETFAIKIIGVVAKIMRCWIAAKTRWWQMGGAGVLVKSFLKLMGVDPGFRPRGLLTMRVSYPRSRKPDELFRRIRARAMQIPGVDAFASTNALPLKTRSLTLPTARLAGWPTVSP